MWYFSIGCNSTVMSDICVMLIFTDTLLIFVLKTISNKTFAAVITSVNVGKSRKSTIGTNLGCGQDYIIYLST